MNTQWIAYLTIVRREFIRFFRIWSQTLLPPIITTSLYFIIFGAFIGQQIADIQGYSYMQFIVPGLVMLSVITSAYTNVVTSFFSSKFMKNLEEIMVAPVSPMTVIAGYVTGGTARGLIIAALVLVVALFFTKLTVVSYFLVIIFAVLTAVMFSLAGLLNGVFAKGFDSVSIFPTFVLTPLTYLGGIFYPIAVLPEFWQMVSKLNPILYLVNGFRYGFLGVSDVSVTLSLVILVGFTAALFAINLYLFKKGYGLRN